MAGPLMAGPVVTGPVMAESWRSARGGRRLMASPLT
jgi:hypothetical protein